MTEKLKETVETILKDEKSEKEFMELKTLEEVYEKCKEFGYKSDYEEFEKDYNTIVFGLSEKLSLEELEAVSGGKMNKKLAKTTAAILSALTLSTSAAPSLGAVDIKCQNPKYSNSKVVNFIKNNPGKSLAMALGLTVTIGAGVKWGPALKDYFGNKNNEPSKKQLYSLEIDDVYGDYYSEKYENSDPIAIDSKITHYFQTFVTSDKSENFNESMDKLILYSAEHINTTKPYTSKWVTNFIYYFIHYILQLNKVKHYSLDNLLAKKIREWCKNHNTLRKLGILREHLEYVAKFLENRTIDEGKKINFLDRLAKMPSDRCTDFFLCSLINNIDTYKECCVGKALSFDEKSDRTADFIVADAVIANLKNRAENESTGILVEEKDLFTNNVITYDLKDADLNYARDSYGHPYIKLVYRNIYSSVKFIYPKKYDTSTIWQNFDRNCPPINSNKYLINKKFNLVLKTSMLGSDDSPANLEWSTMKNLRDSFQEDTATLENFLLWMGHTKDETIKNTTKNFLEFLNIKVPTHSE